MPRGGPDWGAGAQRSIAGVTADVGEAAARLGSPVTYSRTGTVIWMTDFEEGLTPWQQVVIGTGGDVQLASDVSHKGRFSMRLIGGSTSARTAEVYKGVWPQVNNKLGMEVIFSVPAALESFDLNIFLEGPGGSLEWSARAAPDALDLLYRDSSGLFTSLGAHNWKAGNKYNFNYMKLVVDLESSKYVRLLVNNLSFSLAGIDPYAYAATAADDLFFNARATSAAGRNDEAIVDSVIFTSNEP